MTGMNDRPDAQSAPSVRLAERLDEARAEVAALKAQEQAHYASLGPADPSLARLRPGPLKQHRRRVESELNAERDLGMRIRRAESKVHSLQHQLAEQVERERPKLTAADLAGARAVRDRFGWHRVVKVNQKTVKVVVAPGMDDLLPIAKVLEVRA